MIAETPPATPSPGFAALAIVVVDDHSAIRNAVTSLLRSAFPNCRVVAADNAEVAILECRRATPQLVIMDLSLPGMNGIEATRLIKQYCPGTFIVVLSNNDASIYQAESLAAGASAFVSKSRAASDLLNVITGLLRPMPNE